MSTIIQHLKYFLFVATNVVGEALPLPITIVFLAVHIVIKVVSVKRWDGIVLHFNWLFNVIMKYVLYELF